LSADASAESTAPRVRRIVLVDDDEILRLSLRAAFTRAGWKVVAEAPDGKSGVDIALSERPHVVLMDLSMPNMGGIEATRAIRAMAPETEVVVLTVTEDRTVFDALKAGASGYLLKGTPLDQVVDMVEQAMAGGSPISPKIARLILGEFSDRDQSPPAKHAGVELTPRETEILRMLVDGQTAAALADKLCISVHTANAHVRNIYRKLEVTSRAQAVSKALRDKLL
jgi:DNA-binding NarL/FixJ family response regulator